MVVNSTKPGAAHEKLGEGPDSRTRLTRPLILRFALCPWSAPRSSAAQRVPNKLVSSGPKGARRSGGDTVQFRPGLTLQMPMAHLRLDGPRPRSSTKLAFRARGVGPLREVSQSKPVPARRAPRNGPRVFKYVRTGPWYTAGRCVGRKSPGPPSNWPRTWNLGGLSALGPVSRGRPRAPPRRTGQAAGSTISAAAVPAPAVSWPGRKTLFWESSRGSWIS